MSKVTDEKVKRIFYFNITYGCNSKCVFCYSHNTYHNSNSINEIDLDDFFSYLENRRITECDRIIINGGEPLLHNRIIELLDILKNYNCEKLIYTNGRLLKKIDLGKLDSSFRFIVPIHGDEKLHDFITGIPGSYRQTVNGLNSFRENVLCKLDIKIILNEKMIKNEEVLDRVIKSFDNIYLNNAVHLTKMADTIISKKNNCKTLDNDEVAEGMNRIFKYFVKRKFIIKLFDTCLKSFSWLSHYKIENLEDKIEVYFKDCNQERQLILNKPYIKCMDTCEMKKYCISAVDEYKVLEFYKNRLYENLE